MLYTITFIVLALVICSIGVAIFMILHKNSAKQKANADLEKKSEAQPSQIEDEEKSIELSAAIANENIVEDSEESEDNDDEKEQFKGIEDETGFAIIARYRKSFMAKLIQSDDETKSFYNELKNAILSYKKVNSRVSWSYDSINFGRQKLAKFAIRGKTLNLYLALDPLDYGETKYKVEKSESKKYEDTPCLYKIKNERRAKYAHDLIKTLAEKFNLIFTEEQAVNYYLPYETTEELIKKDLIKELISKEKYEDFLLRQHQNEVNSKKRTFISAKEVSNIIVDEVATTLITTEQQKECGRKERGIINVDTISANYLPNEVVDIDSLKDKDLISKSVTFLKVLARGVLDKPLTIKANEFSMDAVKMILLTDGKVIKLS